MEGRKGNVHAPSFSKETREIGNCSLLSLLLPGITKAPSWLGILFCHSISSFTRWRTVWKSAQGHRSELAEPGFKLCHLLAACDFDYLTSLNLFLRVLQARTTFIKLLERLKEKMYQRFLVCWLTPSKLSVNSSCCGYSFILPKMLSRSPVKRRIDSTTPGEARLIIYYPFCRMTFS